MIFYLIRKLSRNKINISDYAFKICNFKNVQLFDYLNNLNEYSDFSHRYGFVFPGYSEKFYGTEYYKIKLSERWFRELNMSESMKCCIKNKFQSYLMIINSTYMLPHIDTGIKTVVNYYINPCDGETIFFEHKKNKMCKSNTNNLFKEIDLNLMCSFKADKFDIWVLDVTKIHAVRFTDKNCKRTVICFQSDIIKFEEFLNLNN